MLHRRLASVVLKAGSDSVTPATLRNASSNLSQLVRGGTSAYQTPYDPGSEGRR
jgi:hypothetical protein